MRAHGGLEDGEGTAGEFVFFELCDFELTMTLLDYGGREKKRGMAGTYVSSLRGLLRSSLEYTLAFAQ